MGTRFVFCAAEPELGGYQTGDWCHRMANHAAGPSGPPDHPCPIAPCPIAAARRWSASQRATS